MKPLIKPKHLQQGDKIAVVSPCNGWAGDSCILWKYNLGVSRLQKLGLEVIAAPNTLYRGMGYSVPALNLLLEQAFTKMNAGAVHNYFEDNRKAAIKLHLNAGFIQTGHKNGIVDFLITKEQYEKQREANSCYC